MSFIVLASLGYLDEPWEPNTVWYTTQNLTWSCHDLDEIFNLYPSFNQTKNLEFLVTNYTGQITLLYLDNNQNVTPRLEQLKPALAPESYILVRSPEPMEEVLNWIPDSIQVACSYAGDNLTIMAVTV